MTDSPTKLCQVCATKAYKYTCPGCGRRTCSLDCSKAHKQETRCSGKRSKTHYIKLAHFTPNDMTSDYVFLEDAYRTADNATRDNNRLISETKSRTGRQQLLTRQCKTLGINIKFMPSGMKRHEQSQSIYLQRQKHILWTIELDFQECDKVLLSHRINESTPIRDIVALHVEERDGNAMTRHTLKPYCDIGVDALHVYLRKEDTPVS
ncbi:hypothetical protein DFJ77DRAFT_429546 [Powellomyces hirtus]|nr:hypothetical protein DFJ77DRAFT_429546 [Powellomyces hirtus]